MINEIEMGYVVELSDVVLATVVGSGDTDEEDGTDPVPKQVKERNKKFCEKYPPKEAEDISTLSGTKNPCKKESSRFHSGGGTSCEW
ncbi:MAG: hypothetical protein QGG10_03760 [Arenicellales bacterium]|jgi:hypothetical protein|nr:hypothetical protein [Arenicellales bacterium]|tara:strand:+ start:296 stop:556 length:261 start_codon:yes stop_codon:yes gene_type:complete